MKAGGVRFATDVGGRTSHTAIVARAPYGVIDHVGHARCNGAEGWGLFEHASMGRHDPTGFADWSSVAP